MKANINRWCWVVALSFLISCTEDYLPKPKGFNKIDLPPHDYQLLTEKHPYVFEYSKGAVIKKDVSLIAEPHWIDIYYPGLHAYIQLTYKKIKGSSKNFDEHVDDSHKLAGKHNIKAYSIEEGQVKTPKGYYATIFELTGEVPSQFQFYITDSSQNFLRGAVYFQTATQNDSLAPVIEYLKYDAMHLINSLEWKTLKD
ncbi:MAG TPA: gliding motility lipoprotein GldD [Cytophagaceae bacterium]|jgi:gliding motility-associated lipoprotein GldD|nr:gliding motility lipoprotein GldD [Cytophagaceae bacterium]